MSGAARRVAKQLKKTLHYEEAEPMMCLNCAHFSASGSDGGAIPYKRSRCQHIRTWVEWFGVCDAWVDKALGGNGGIVDAETLAEAITNVSDHYRQN